MKEYPWDNRKISLVLSGGGIRAMMFHMGVLKYLAECQALESVSSISTVSGGSLLLGLIVRECGYKWPSSAEYLSSVYPALRDKLCSKSLQWGAIRQLIWPQNWKYLLSRSNLLAKALQNEWGVTAGLSVLEETPAWSINGTTAETGKRFRFKHDSLGDYTLGYASAENYPLADALAVSAAFPGGFGPLSLNTSNYVWKKRQDWNSPEESAEVIKIRFNRLHLYDGGVYDNLGLEPFFDTGKVVPKKGVDFIYVSDAGAPLGEGFPSFSLSPFRLKRVADIMSDQTRALRVRSYMSYLEEDKNRGSYIYICVPASEKCRIGNTEPANFPTTLRRVTVHEFDCIAGHGYEVAMKYSDSIYLDY